MYACITKYLELIIYLTIEAFVNYLCTFIAYKTICKTIVLDNETNFTGMQNKLHELGMLLKNKKHNTKISDALGKYKFFTCATF